MHCEYRGRGCSAEFTNVEDLQEHLETCVYKGIECSNAGCQKVLNEREVKDHELELCRFRRVTCDECKVEMVYHELRKHVCTLRREIDDIKHDLAEFDPAQIEDLAIKVDDLEIALEKLGRSSRTATKNVVNFMNSDILAIGGRRYVGPPVADITEVLPSVERFNLFNQTWTAMPELNIARYDAQAVFFENQIIVCGGTMSVIHTDPTDSIEVLDLNANPAVWKHFGVNLPVKVSGHKCIVYKDSLLIIGGSTMDCKELDTIYELLLVPPYSSQLLGRMKMARWCPAVELFDSQLLIAGGILDDDNVEIYDIQRKKSVGMPPLVPGRWGMKSVRRGRTMLLIGGWSSKSVDETRIIEYDFMTGQSKCLIEMKHERAGCSAVYYGDTLIIIGPSEDGRNSVDAFNFPSYSWRKLSSTNVERSHSAVVVFNKKFDF